MSLIFSIVSGLAGGIFKAARGAAGEAEAAQAQATAATDARARGTLDAARAGGAHGSFAQHFQAQIAKATDTDGDGMISRAELEQQVTKGGGSSDAAGTLFKAMDRNGDGKLTVDEFKDSLPVPRTDVAQQILALIQAHRAANAASGANGAAGGGTVGSASGPSPIRAASSATAPPSLDEAIAAARARMPAVDPATTLAKLAAQLH